MPLHILLSPPLFSSTEAKPTQAPNQMESRLWTQLSLLILIFTFPFFNTTHSSPSPFFRGMHPIDEKYYDGQVIKCKNSSRTFTRDRVNDDFCDCPNDGTDEPGTSACPNGKFYCRNLGSTPRFLFSSRVNDHICDCCDGSDEYDGLTQCPNTCIMGGGIEFKAENHYATRSSDAIRTKESMMNGKWDELMSTFQDLKVFTFFQLIVVVYIFCFCAYRRMKSRRRQSRFEKALPNYSNSMRIR